MSSSQAVEPDPVIILVHDQCGRSSVDPVVLTLVSVEIHVIDFEDQLFAETSELFEQFLRSGQVWQSSVCLKSKILTGLPSPVNISIICFITSGGNNDIRIQWNAIRKT